VKKLLFLLIAGFISTQAIFAADSLRLSQSQTLHYAILVNNYFMQKHSDVGAKSYVGGKERDSRIWTRGVYYEGLMSFYRQYPQPECLKYTVDWGNFHKWISTSGSGQARHADYQCCGQTYLDLYMMDPTATVRKTHIKQIIDAMVSGTKIDDWYWIDAIQMAMPIFAQLGTIENNNAYFERMYQMYMFTRDKHGGSTRGGGLPLFNTADGFWYRDSDYDPPYTDQKERDKPCYWSRGCGWVYVALARVLYYSPGDVVHREQYISDFKIMSEAYRSSQRADGFWNVSLAAPSNTGHANSPGPETTGTALAIAGMAYGINTGILDSTYLPCVIRAWNALCETAVHPDGFLGYVQGTGANPEDSQPVTYITVPNFEDFGTGCFLLAAAEMYALGNIDLTTSVKTPKSQDAISEFNCVEINKTLHIGFNAGERTDVDIELFDINGRKITNINFRNSFGKNTCQIDVNGLSGLYLCRLNSKNCILTKKIILK
jgi:Predicted unsaturated glucuronyl hydrolase involved in regulation of bacterial surface properties, and related proteins